MGTKLSELATASSILSSDKLVGLISSVAKTVTLAILESQIFTDKAASTGVPDATKFPKALGADLVALITAAGYSLAPAAGTDNLDNIADGTTYKRVLAAIATALNAGNGAFLVEPGKAMIDSAADDWDTFIAPGLYDVEYIGDGVHAPITGALYGNLISFSPLLSSAVHTQIFFSTSPRRHFLRTWSGTAWYPWEEIFTGYSSGNGGQPPAPKPATGTPAGGANGVGKRLMGSRTTGETLYFSGASNLTGTWDCWLFYRNSSTGVVSFENYIGGGDLTGVIGANLTYWYVTTRIQ